MRIVQSVPPVTTTRAKSSSYDRFFDGRIWEITPEDFPHTTLTILRSTLMRRAVSGAG